jgi:hypothetical protein
LRADTLEWRVSGLELQVLLICGSVRGGVLDVIRNCGRSATLNAHFKP